MCVSFIFFFFSSRRRHTRFDCDWSSDVCSSDLDNFGRSLSALAQGGRVSVIGNLQGDELRGSVYPLLLGRATVQGIGVAHRRALQDLVRAVDWLKLQPVIDSEYALADLPAALEHLERGAFGKLVLRM